MRDAVDGARNLALFGGLGVVWVLSSPSGRVWRSVWHAAVVGLLLSVSVESLQLFSPIRDASILDVTTNTLGALAGAACVALVAYAVDRARGRASFVGIPAYLFAVPYWIAALMETFAPLFRQDLLPQLGGSVAARIARAVAAIRPHSIVQLSATDFLLFVPAGAFTVAALVEGGVSYAAAWPLVALAGGALLVADEVFHGVAAEPIVLGAILVHVLAVATGAVLAASLLPRATVRLRGRGRPRALLAAYATVIMLWSWRPFVPDLSASSMAEQFSSDHWVPLQAMAQRVDLFSVADVVTQFCLYVPLGALLAVWPLRRRGAWSGLYPAFYLATVMELGKIVVAERFFDITHVLIQIAGATAGAVVVRRSGYRPYGAVLDEPA